jgi:uncharacterized membrane protein YqjE
MPDEQSISSITIGEGKSTMLQSMLLLLFCLLVGVLSLAVCVWVAVSGQLLTMDGLLTIAISLAVGAIFVANVAWSFHTGELPMILSQLRKPRAAADGPGDQAGVGQK